MLKAMFAAVVFLLAASLMVNVHATARVASFSFLALVLVVAVPHTTFAQEDPELGTWKLDTAKIDIPSRTAAQESTADA